MNKIELEIYGIVPSQIQGSYNLILAEQNGDRKVPIIIGQFEAQYIAIQLEGLYTGRPLTHDLFNKIFTEFDIKISDVLIYNLNEGIFYSYLNLKKGNIISTIECRTSDAIAIAIRNNCPIFISEEIINSVGIKLEVDNTVKPGRQKNEDTPSTPKSENKLKNKSVEELEAMLDLAIQKEDYLKAAMIRDELERRK